MLFIILLYYLVIYVYLDIAANKLVNELEMNYKKKNTNRNKTSIQKLIIDVSHQRLSFNSFFDILKKEQCIKASLAQPKKSVKIKMLLHDYKEIHIKQNHTQ